MKFVLDATAIRSGMTFSGEFQWFITPSVKSEIARGKAARDLELLVTYGPNKKLPENTTQEKVSEIIKTSPSLKQFFPIYYGHLLEYQEKKAVKPH